MRRLRPVLTAVVVALTLAVAPRVMGGGEGASRAQAVALDADIVASAVYWGTAYRIDPLYIERVILCESGGDRYAYNVSGAIGVLQIMPATGIALENRLNADPTLAPGLTTFDPETRVMTDPDAQIHVFAWAVHAGLEGLWTCA